MSRLSIWACVQTRMGSRRKLHRSAAVAAAVVISLPFILSGGVRRIAALPGASSLHFFRDLTTKGAQPHDVGVLSQRPAASCVAWPSISPSRFNTNPVFAGRVAKALREQSPIIAKFEWTRQQPAAACIAPPALSLPDECYDELGFHAQYDMECFRAIAEYTAGEMFPPHTPLCWGYSDRNGTQEPLVFHTLVLTATISDQAPLLLWSFLATQCCDAVINVWLAPNAYQNTSRPAMDIPAHHAHRIVYKLYDAAAEWAAVKDDFPEFLHNQSAVTAMTAMPDLRYHSDWARMVIMYAHGGTWVDLDTVFLRDMRMVFPFQPFMYRAGIGIEPNNAVCRLGKRPNAMSRRIMHEALRGGHPGPYAVFANLGMNSMAVPTGLQYLSEALFDFAWYRWADSEIPAMTSVHPEFYKGHKGRYRWSDNWDDFFMRVAANDTELEAWRATPFMPGSLSYHWHGSITSNNRYKAGLPVRTWAGVLVARYEALAREKAAVCAVE